MCFKTTIIAILYLLNCGYTSASFAAEKETSVKLDTYRISLGTSVSNFDTNIELNSKEFAQGIGIDFEDDLDFDEQVTSGWLGGYWRFANRHRISFSYSPYKRTARHTLDTDIRINDQTIEAGALVKSNLKTSIYDINYMYSFYQSSDWEISLTGGIYRKLNLT